MSEDKVVMIIDDEATVRYCVRTILERQKFQTVTCASAVEAITVLKDLVPDLVICDYDLGKFSNGIDLACGIRQSTRTAIPIIIMSGLSTVRDVAKAHDLEFIEKPLSRRKLMPVIRGCLSIAETNRNKEDRQARRIMDGSHRLQ